jgi:hypothetical protein
MTNDPMRQAPPGLKAMVVGKLTGSERWPRHPCGGQRDFEINPYARVKQPDFKGSGRHLGVPQNQLDADGTTTAQKSQT